MENRELLYIYTFRKECLPGYQVRAMEMLEGRSWFIAAVPPEEHPTLGNEVFKGDERVASYYHHHGAFHLTIKPWQLPFAERAASRIIKTLIPLILLAIAYHVVLYGTLLAM